MPLDGILASAEAITPPMNPVQKGGSRYVLVPKDWPEGCRVRVVLVSGGP